MKLNQLLLLSTTLLIGTVPISSYATALSTNSPSQTTSSSELVAQNQVVALKSGSFVAAEKPTTGAVRIVRDNGHRFLEIDGAFSTSDQGPDLHVLLDTVDKPPQAYQNQGRVINLGRLRSYNGAQRYPIPDSINLNSFKSVVIWCRMANATFGYAPLRSTNMANAK
ncbi:DM13 domain-containing protein [Aerosakkonemataceae cyanobacterium BLCC-F50]|uniref:DM13 domain-containing protein n=1 Tax=Floridaenema flaviceps BLCC-F50 TaxID=3153642 RepID=A0ABV4XZR3_9CYAN